MKRRYWRRRLKDFAYLFGLLVCLGGVSYPLLANWLYEKRQDIIITDYEEGLDAAGNEAVEAEWTACVQYNHQLAKDSPVAAGDAFGEEKKAELLADYGQRLNLSGNDIMGYLEIPKIDVLLPVYHGVSEKVLETGLGHIPETTLPVGGTSTHAAITGHSGVSDRRLFTDLDQLEAGDVFFFHVLGDTLCYEVKQLLVVLPEETEALAITEGADEVTLITCTPFGINDHRLLVRGHRVELPEIQETEVLESEKTETLNSTWYREYFKAVGIGTILLAIVSGIGKGRTKKKRRRKKANGDD